jgi:hypothetical protein
MALSRFTGIAAFALAAAMVPAAWAAGKANAELEAQYKQERAECTSGRSSQDRATCLKEAAAAYGEAKKNNLNTSGDGSLARNAMKRCDAQPQADRADCRARINGQGTTKGSVAGGGLIRETVTPVK